MRRITATAAAVAALTLTLTGCSSGPGQTADTAPADPATSSSSAVWEPEPAESSVPAVAAGDTINLPDAAEDSSHPRFPVILSAGSILALINPPAGGGEPGQFRLALSTYDTRTMAPLITAELPIDELGCDPLLTTVDGRVVLVGYSDTTAPAEGIKPAETTAQLTAYDITGAEPEQRWQTAIDWLPCLNSDDIGSTADGRYVITRSTNGSESTLITDTATGTTTRGPWTRGITGTLLHQNRDDNGSTPLFDPATGTRTGRFSPDGNFTLGNMTATPNTVIYDNSKLVVFAYDGRRLWENRDGTIEHHDWDTDTLVIWDSNSYDADADLTLRVDPSTGEPIWTIPALVDICGNTGTELVGIANNQIVILDLDSGDQETYYPDIALPTSSAIDPCPTVFQRGFILRDGETHITN